MSFITQIEEVIEVVSDWAVETILDTVNALSPDGKPFGYVEGTDEDRIKEYMQYRGNSQAWMQKLMDDTESIVQKLSESGLPSDEIMGVRPWDISDKVNKKYSYDMERLIEKVGLP